LLSGATLIAAGAALVGAGLSAGSAEAGGKLKQTLINYQPTPKGRARCDNCAQWQAPSACKLVDGVISPAGWCSVYAPKT
jgi:hypothetical protein